jgi:hypothetical protein
VGSLGQVCSGPAARPIHSGIGRAAGLGQSGRARAAGRTAPDPGNPGPLAELSGFLGGAAVVAYPSLGEGFGLPILEAMAAGAAVLTTRRLSLPEVGGDAVAYCGIDATTSPLLSSTCLMTRLAGAELSAAAQRRGRTSPGPRARRCTGRPTATLRWRAGGPTSLLTWLRTPGCTIERRASP